MKNAAEIADELFNHIDSRLRNLTPAQMMAVLQRLQDALDALNRYLITGIPEAE